MFEKLIILLDVTIQDKSDKLLAKKDKHSIVPSSSPVIFFFLLNIWWGHLLHRWQNLDGENGWKGRR